MPHPAALVERRDRLGPRASCRGWHAPAVTGSAASARAQHARHHRRRPGSSPPPRGRRRAARAHAATARAQPSGRSARARWHPRAHSRARPRPARPRRSRTHRRPRARRRIDPDHHAHQLRRRIAPGTASIIARVHSAPADIVDQLAVELLPPQPRAAIIAPPSPRRSSAAGAGCRASARSVSTSPCIAITRRISARRPRRRRHQHARLARRSRSPIIRLSHAASPARAISPARRTRRNDARARASFSGAAAE